MPVPGPHNIPPATGSSRGLIWSAGLLLVLSALAAYHNSFRGPFVFDDVASIVTNPSIRQLWPPGEVLSPPSAHGVTVGGRPVANLTLALNYALGGTDVWGYHALNLVIHALAGLLLFGVVRRTLLLPTIAERHRTAALPLALIVALGWTLHPLQTESVTYVVQRVESLMGLFYLLTLYAFVRSADSPNPKWWQTLSVSACALGMASKEVMVSAPLLVLLYDRAFVSGSFQGAWRRHARLYIALASTWLVLGGLMLSTDGRGGTAGFGTELTWSSYALTQLGAITHYLRLTLWPQPLVFDYGDAVTTGWRVLPSALIVGLLLGGTLYALRRLPKLGFLGAWFFAILAPSSSVVPVATQTMAEHRMYLPLAAVLMLAGLGLWQLAGRRTLAVGLVLAAGLGIATAQRNTDYRDALTLWRDTATKCPENARAQVNLGNAYFDASRIDEAIACYENALRSKPQHVEACTNLGNALARAGQPEAALARYDAALAIDPHAGQTHSNRGALLLRLGRVAEAQAALETAVQLVPDHVEARGNLGNALVLRGRVADAIPHYEIALRIDPGVARTHYNLAYALRQTGRNREAREHCVKALELQPDFAPARTLLSELGQAAN